MVKKQTGYPYFTPPGRDSDHLETERVIRGLRLRRFIAYAPARAVFTVRKMTSSRLLKGTYSVVIPAAHVTHTVWTLVFSFLMSVYNIASFAAAAAAMGLNRIRHEARLRTDGRQAGRAVSAITMTLLAVLMASTFFLTMGFEVFLDGTSIGYVKAQKDFEIAVYNVEQKVSDVLGRSYFIYPDVTYRFGIYDKRNTLNQTQVEANLYSQVSEVRYLNLLKIDGQLIGGVTSVKQLEDALNAILARYPLTAPTDRVEFVRPVEITNELVPSEYLRDISDIESILNSNVHDAEYYTVQKGDKLSTIAEKHSMKLDTLRALNPELDTTIKVGQELLVSAAVPYMSVKLSRQIKYTEVIPFDTERVNDSGIYKGESKVKTAGADGEVLITADVVNINGIEKDRVETDRLVTVEPVTKVVLVGTKTPPPKYPTGTFIRPYRGILTSNYGYRGREFHTGVDFAGPTGSTIVASDGGVVTFAGWKGNLGNLVILTHKNGLQTYYAHCSRLLVKVGQQVGQGETIARVGSTGRSTGPHVHFEVRVNGAHVNPWKYLNR